MKKILALTTINNTLSLKDALEKIKKDYGNLIRLRKVYLEKYEDPAVSLDDIEREIEDSDIILVDIRGDERIGRELPGLLENKNKIVVSLVWGSPLILSLTSLGVLDLKKLLQIFQDKHQDLDNLVRNRKFNSILKIVEESDLEVDISDLKKDLQNWFHIMDYYGQNDPENLKNMFLFLLKNYITPEIIPIKEIPLPEELPEYGLYLPYRGIYADLGSYKKAARFDDHKATVGVLFYSGMHFDDTRPLAESLYEKLAGETNLIIVFSNVQHNLKAMKEYFEDIDLFVNLQFFQLNGGPMGGDPRITHQFFQEKDVPYLIALRGYETDIQKWSQEDEGLNPMEVILGVTLPELDGGIEPFFTAGLETSDDEDLGEIRVVKVVEERMDKFSQRILNWIKLRNKKNSDKKIAILTYNYPPGEENLASSGYLDVFESLKIFLDQLKEQGYQLEMPDLENGMGLKDLFLNEGVLNSPHYLQKTGIRIPLDGYLNWFDNLDPSIKDAVYQQWGPAPGDIMVDENHFLIPGLELGNIFLGIQPTRGVHEDPENAYHDKDLPPHHQYLAFYYYLEELLGVDAVLHFGMHGTLEFTPGKEVGLSSKCYPDILIGSLPNIYYYWVGNTSESTIAKRRSYALCISHASPPMKSSKLYEEYLILEDFLQQYRENGDEITLELIRDKASELNFPEDIEDIRREIYRMKRRLIPLGLHVMDKNFIEDEMVDYLSGVLRMDRDYPSIFKIISKIEGEEWDDIKNSYKGDLIEDQAKIILKYILSNSSSSESDLDLNGNLDEIFSHLPEGYENYVREMASTINMSSESKSLLNALEGSYILPSRGGDPIRDPEVYPTGKSMYAFDPRQIPTISAENRGKMGADILIQSYFEKNGEYPGSVGVVLWGFETLKTGGDTIALILHLMGIRIKQQKGPWVKKLEVIPLEELGRPRIDVAITICGIFRDTLGTHIELINRAIKMVAHLDEPCESNYIRKHYLQEKENMGDLSLSRIFGPSPTEYATNLTNLVENSSWEDEEELAGNYQDSMCYAYTPGGIKRTLNGLSSVLSKVDIVTQERDNVEYEVTDLDHYYEFLGGLSRTVQSVKGEKADMMVIDSTEDEIYVEKLSSTIERATRTRILNPLWLDGMLKHDFHGTKKIKDRVEHLLGFSATTDQVENWVFDNVADRLIFDDDMRKRLQENNPFATVKIGEILMETHNRGYWDTDEKKIEKLKEIVVDMESEIE